LCGEGEERLARRGVDMEFAIRIEVLLIGGE